MANNLPKEIWLLDMGDEWVWCDCPEPDYEEREAVKYIRADTLGRKKKQDNHADPPGES